MLRAGGDALSRVYHANLWNRGPLDRSKLLEEL